MIIIKSKRFTFIIFATSLIPLHSFAASFPEYPSTTYSIEETFCLEDNPFHILADKSHSLDPEYVPSPLVVPDVLFSFSGFHEKRQMQETAAYALEDLFEAALSQNIHLVAISGYRSYERQATIYANNVARDGQAVADTYSARPGTSEHQTGLAMDISSASANYALTAQFGETIEGQWLANHAHEHGFILSYPEGKEHITGYTYEPWHVRYVGIDLATFLHTNDLLLQEIEHCCTESPSTIQTSIGTSTPSLNQEVLPIHKNGVFSTLKQKKYIGRYKNW